MAALAARLRGGSLKGDADKSARQAVHRAMTARVNEARGERVSA